MVGGDSSHFAFFILHYSFSILRSAQLAKAPSLTHSG